MQVPVILFMAQREQFLSFMPEVTSVLLESTEIEALSYR
jgi:hypothetical protein